MNLNLSELQQWQALLYLQIQAMLKNKFLITGPKGNSELFS